MNACMHVCVCMQWRGVSVCVSVCVCVCMNVHEKGGDGNKEGEKKWVEETEQDFCRARVA